MNTQDTWAAKATETILEMGKRIEALERRVVELESRAGMNGIEAKLVERGGASEIGSGGGAGSVSTPKTILAAEAAAYRRAAEVCKDKTDQLNATMAQVWRGALACECDIRCLITPDQESALDEMLNNMFNLTVSELATKAKVYIRHTGHTANGYTLDVCGITPKTIIEKVKGNVK